MLDSSPMLHLPSTPISSRPQYLGLSYVNRPLNSSPLASPDGPKSSPVAAAQARRRSQYKSKNPSTPVPSSSRTLVSAGVCGSGDSVFGSGSGRTSATFSGEESQKAFLRERFKVRCFERAARARAKAIRGKRYASGSEASSDEVMDCENEEEEDDDVFEDELFRRIMQNVNHKQRHSYRLSYADEVGSSLDPDMEDISGWEHQLREPTTSTSHPPPHLPVPELTPEDLDDEELAAYAEECVKQAAEDDFGDLPEDVLFGWSDMEDFEDAHVGDAKQKDDMDITH